MGYSENPIKPAYWFGNVDPRPLALFRIGLGLTLLHDLFDFTHDFRAFLTDEGMLPRGVEPMPYQWSVFDLVGSPFAVGVVFTLGVLAVAAFTAGFATRIATIASWIFLSSIHVRNAYITDGGDDLVRILLFWSIFAEMGACWSVDAWRTKRPVRAVPAIGLRLLQWHIIVLYGITGMLKLRQGWSNGTAIYLALQLEGFLRPLGVLLRQSPFMCRISTWMVMTMEMIFPFAAVSPFFLKTTRKIAIACGLLVQGGIFMTMRVGVFTETMLWVLVLFLLPEWIDRAEAWVRSRYKLAQATFDAEALAKAEDRSSPFLRALIVLLGIQFAVSVWDYFLGRRLPLPAVAVHERSFLNLWQPMGLFDQIYAVPHWSAPAMLEDGSTVDLIKVVAPGAADEPGAHYSRWNKYTFKWKERALHYPELGAYFCRAYDEHGGAKVRSFTLVNDAQVPTPPGGVPLPPKREVLHTQVCEGS